jgi:hypothetical protein
VAGFDEVFRTDGVNVVQTPFRAPQANAHAERFVRTAPTEGSDWLLILGPRYLDRVLRVYGDHYNTERPHRALGRHPRLANPPPPPQAELARRDRLGGLLREYRVAAARRNHVAPSPSRRALALRTAARGREAYLVKGSTEEGEAMTVNAPRMRLEGPRRARPARSRFGISRARLTASDAPAARPTTAAAAAFAVALGALLEYFLDPSAGRRRRHTARDRIISKLRRSERRAVTRARRAESQTVGIFRRTLNARHAPNLPPDDVALAHKVQTELFRRARVPKGRIDVNAEDGAVFLRGVVERHEDIARVEAVAERITGVRRVENLLHLPGTPAPASRPTLVRDRAT